MNIVVLDGYTLNPGDLSWDDLRELGECKIYDRTPPEKTVERAPPAEVVLTNKTEVDATVMERCPALRYVGLLSTGTNVVDLEAARRKEIVVTNVPSYATESVAQHVFALLLELVNRVGHHARTVREGRWSACRDFCYWDYPLVELSGLTMGIVGYGDIGSAVAARARAFGMNVLAHDIDPASVDDNAEAVDLDDLFERSDMVSLNCPLTDSTEGLVDADRLERMKDSAFLVNTSRGPVVNERELADALHSGQIAGAALDVMTREPPAADNPLLTARNCFITPHVAWATRAAREHLMEVAVRNVKAFLEGEPQNVVA